MMRGVTSDDGKGGISSTTIAPLEVIVGYAIDASTIAGTPRRVGWMSIDLSQFGSKETNYLDDTCTMDSELLAPCLNAVVLAQYKPFPPEDGGLGSYGTANGFLWFTPASSPYNYR
jgi:hypothetical protein